LNKKKLSGNPNQVPHGIEKTLHEIMNFSWGRAQVPEGEWHLP